MAIIDADTHVIETEHTWDFMLPEDQQHRPQVLVPRVGEVKRGDFSGFFGGVREYWLIGNRVTQKRSDFSAKSETPEEAREMENIQKRLAHMDELGVDVHVLYPTIFLTPLTRYAEVEVALARGYNRWMADIWRQAPTRMRWAVVPPVLNLEEAINELHFGKEHGACAVFMYGYPQERRLSEPYFYPLYREASQLNLPICLHATQGNVFMFELLSLDAGFSTFKLPVVGAFHDLLMKNIPSKFPDLRWGFVETSSQWVPYALNDMMLRIRKAGRPWWGREVLKENRMYVACQTADDLQWVLDYVGDDNIVIGSDYGHNDTSSELVALRRLKSDGKVPASSVDKILEANARELYAL